jgi:DNA-binding SARP family transcriptional activator
LTDRRREPIDPRRGFIPRWTRQSELVLHQDREDQSARGLRVELLHGFELTHCAEPVRLPLSAQRVVAFVALRRRPVQRLHVAGSLWLDSSEDHANASLRTALWRLRLTHVPVVDASSTRIGLNRTVQVDVDEVTEIAEAAIRNHGSLPPDQCGLLLPVGELLADWYDDWVIVERERIRHLQLRALEALCTRLTAEGRYAEAVDAGDAAVCAEPLRESAHRVVIEALLAEGNVSDALRQYRLCRDLLGRQLGVCPSEALENVVGGLPVR